MENHNRSSRVFHTYPPNFVKIEPSSSWKASGIFFSYWQWENSPDGEQNFNADYIPYTLTS